MTTNCKICGKKSVGRYLCRSHYNALWRHRKDELVKHEVAGLARRTPLPNEVRFKKKYRVNKITGCWEWTAFRNADGYGVFWNRERLMQASRYSYITYVGPIPEGNYVLHKCDNPGCVNPAHLFVGTQMDNMMDAHSKGRMKQYKLTHDDIHAIKASNLSARKLAIQFGVSKSTIHRSRSKLIT